MGRFITADTIVQSPDTDPQTFNRYSYCGNNPIVRVDPSGNFWDLILMAVVSYFIDSTIKGVVTGDWSNFTGESLQSFAINTAITAGFNFGNEIGYLTSYITGKILDTKPGRKLIDFVAKEYYDDILGLNPQAAHVVADIVIYSAVSLEVEQGLASLDAGKGILEKFDSSNREHLDTANAELGGNNTYGGVEADTNPNKGWITNERRKTYVLKTESGRGMVGEAEKYLGAVHTGARMSNFPGKNGQKPSFLPKGIFGFCHQATNMTLLQSGTSTVVSDFSNNWSSYATTYVYGNYGGGLLPKIHRMYISNENNTE